MPEHHGNRTQVWTADELARFLDAIAAERLYALFHVIAFTGMRRGEVLGLHWDDIELSAGHIVVTRQVTDA